MNRYFNEFPEHAVDSEEIEKLDTVVVPFIEIVHETHLAYLMSFADGEGYFVEQWVPKSITFALMDNQFTTYPTIGKEYNERTRKIG